VKKFVRKFISLCCEGWVYFLGENLNFDCSSIFSHQMVVKIRHSAVAVNSIAPGVLDEKSVT
jgi:hypothetical protein